MSGFRPPPPGSLPPGVGSPDMQDAIQDMVGTQGQKTSTAAGSNNPANNALTSALQGKQGAKPQPARSITSPVGEAKYLAQDIAKGVIEFLPGPLKDILGPASTDTPEEAAKKQTMLRRYQQLNAEDQQYVQKKLQADAAIKQKEQEEEMKKKQLAAQQKPALEEPQGKVRGDKATGQSNKQRTINKLQDDRKKMKSSG